MTKLPVFNVLGDVISSSMENVRYAFAISWPWLLILFPLRIAVEIHKLYYGFHPIASYNNTQYDWPGLVLAAISFFAFCSIAVNWHRFILNGEVAEGWERLRVDSRTWTYFGFTIAITVLAYLMIIVPAIILGLLGYALNGFAVFLAVIGAIALVLGVLGWSARSSITLVSIALGNEKLSMRDCLSLTAGNHWRIIGIYFLLALFVILMGLVSLFATYLVSLVGWPILNLALGGAELLFSWFETILGITMLTALYAFFVQKRELA